MQSHFSLIGEHSIPGGLSHKIFRINTEFSLPNGRDARKSQCFEPPNIASFWHSPVESASYVFTPRNRMLSML